MSPARARAAAAPIGGSGSSGNCTFGSWKSPVLTTRTVYGTSNTVALTALTVPALLITSIVIGWRFFVA